MSEPPRFGEADLTNCDREPIHVPGSVQPHGALLAVTEPDLTVVQVSENVPRLLGADVAQLLGAPLSRALGDAAVAELRAVHLPAASLEEANPAAVTVGAGGGERRLDATLHRSGGLLLVEVEPAPPRQGRYVEEFVRRSRHALAELQEAPTSAEMLERAAREVRALAGFDRAMVYRFDRDWHGEVVAESRVEELEPYLGLHWPASDIPRQARELYARSWLRIIPDSAYVPARLVPAENPRTGAPLDLSGSVLRSVSPLHLEYLRNMGVAASMSISLLHDGRLWGLVACHHRTPRLVPYELRAVCELIGRILSWQLSAKLAVEEAERRSRAKASHARFLAAAGLADAPLVDALFRAERELLAFAGATGVALCHEGAVHLAGATPGRDEVRALAEWLSAARREDVFHTDALALEHPPALAYADVASGVLAACVAREQGEWLLWFRPEVVRTVTWGGDPAKPVEADAAGVRLSPRKSFAAWRETVRLHARPWGPTEVEAAHDLRVSVLALLARRAAELKRLNDGLAEALRARDDFVSVAAHELRTPVSTLSLQLHTMARAARRGDAEPPERAAERLAIVERQVRRLEELVEVLLDVSRLRSGRLSLAPEDAALDDVLRAAVERASADLARSGSALALEGRRGLRGRWDPLRLEQVFSNLLSNAIKYGAGRPITVTTGAEAGRAWIAFRDEGIGIPPDAVPRIFDRFERAVSERDYAGLGLGLWISREIVRQMGGDVVVESAVGRGSTFTAFLPVEPGAAAPGEAP